MPTVRRRAVPSLGSLWSPSRQRAATTTALMNGSRASRCGFHAYLTLDFEWNFKAICKKYDIVYLIDEVQTGGGPTGK